MPAKRLSTWIALIVIGIGTVVALVVGLFAYMSLTARPLHTDAQSVPSTQSADAGANWGPLVKQAQQIARAELTAQNLPGLSVAVAVNGEIVWAEGFGWANIEDRVPVTPDTRFRTGEVSKALTSVAVGLLVEEKKLGLDDEIQTYVPGFPKKQWPITVRQLMAQVAGLRDDAGDEAWLKPCDETLQGLQLFDDDRLLSEPGTQHRGSSYSWILVSAAVEAAAREPFFKFMRARIFEPLGMVGTRPDYAAQPIAERASFYFPKFAGDNRYGVDPAREGDHSCYAGGGAFLSTASDLVRFGIAVNSGKLLQPATLAMLQTPQRLPSGQETGYGLGWNVETVSLAGAPARMAGHGTKADFIGGTSDLMTFPERGIVVAATTNTSFADTKSIALQIAEVFAGHRGDAVR